jgi:hypothetical protein
MTRALRKTYQGLTACREQGKDGNVLALASALIKWQLTGDTKSVYELRLAGAELAEHFG